MIQLPERDPARLDAPEGVAAADAEAVAGEGQHVVITPQTAGSAGAAHASDSPQES